MNLKNLYTQVIGQFRRPVLSQEHARLSIWMLVSALAAATLLSSVSRSPVPVSVRLGWQANANSIGQIVALKRGYYEHEGLDVTLHPGGLTAPSVETVAGGIDQIGFANGPDLVINARAKGLPIRIVSVVQQNSYHRFFVRDTSPIQSPADWAGKRVGVKFASPTYLLYRMLLAKFNISRESITEIPLGFSTQPFLAGDIDVYPGAATNEAISMELQGVHLRSIDPAEYGVKSMGNVIFTNETMMADHPQVIRSFVDATIRGWKWCLDPSNEQEAVDLLISAYPELDRQKELLALRANRALVLGDNAELRPVGSIDGERLREIIGYMRQFGVLTSDLRAEDVYTDQFTAPRAYSTRIEPAN